MTRILKLMPAVLLCMICWQAFAGNETATDATPPERVHTEVMAWSNITGVRMDGELVDFESTLRVGNPDGYIEATGRERQNNVQYRREGTSQIVNIPLHGAHFTQKVTDIDHQTVKLEWEAEADENLDEGAYFCLTFNGDNYTDASFKIRSSFPEI